MSAPDIQAAVTLLLSLGYRVTSPTRAESLLAQNRVALTPAEVAARLGLKPSTISMRLARPGCPVFPCKTGISGRITRLTLTEELEAYLRTPLQPGKRLAAAPAYMEELAR